MPVIFGPNLPADPRSPLVRTRLLLNVLRDVAAGRHGDAAGDGGPAAVAAALGRGGVVRGSAVRRLR